LEEYTEIKIKKTDNNFMNVDISKKDGMAFDIINKFMNISEANKLKNIFDEENENEKMQKDLNKFLPIFNKMSNVFDDLTEELKNNSIHNSETLDDFLMDSREFIQKPKITNNNENNNYDKESNNLDKESNNYDDENDKNKESTNYVFNKIFSISEYISKKTGFKFDSLFQTNKEITNDSVNNHDEINNNNSNNNIEDKEKLEKDNFENCLNENIEITNKLSEMMRKVGLNNINMYDLINSKNKK
jgi:hypothetical protein